MYFLSYIADVFIGVNYKYEYTRKVFNNYISNAKIIPSFTVTVTDDMINFEKELAPNFPPEYLENIAVFRSIANTLMREYNAILFHSSAISYKNNGFLFTAKSGTGKSTHTKLLSEYNSDILYINDDKPFIRYIASDGCFYVYGSPWQGKHHRGANVKIPLKAICLLNRGIENKITKINSFEALSEILTQTVKPTDELEVDAFMNIISLLTEKVDFYKLYCNMESDAPKTSFNEMINKY